MFNSKDSWPLWLSCLCLLCQPAATQPSGANCPRFFQCGLGKYSYHGQTTCSDCPKGYKCPSTTTPAPVACAPGEYQSLTGISSCDPCPAGSYCASHGMFAAIDCGMGKYSSAGSKLCTDCPRGHKCPSTTTSDPVACAHGEYQILTGMSSCSSCPVGFTCPSTSTVPFPKTAGSNPNQAAQASNCQAEEHDLLPNCGNQDVLRKEVSCNITDTEVLSAIERAKTTECKKKIAALGCDLLKPDFYPRSLPRYCPLKNDKEKLYFVGCFRDMVKDRDLNGMTMKFKEKNSQQYCVEWCYRGGFLYAGLQYQYECWCGDTYGKHGAANAGECQMKCPGLSTSTCGGRQVQSVYKTGIGRTVINRVQLPVGKETSPTARVAFILTVNGRSDRQVKRLLSLIYRRQHFYLLHVDARQDFLRRELERFLEERPLLKRNVRLADYGIAPIWGGSSLLTVFLKSIQELLEWSKEWDFVLNLSETDLPVKSVDHLSAFLAQYKGNNFLYSYTRDIHRYVLEHAVDRTFFECEQRMWRLGYRALPDGIRIDGGSDWFILDRKFANYSVFSKDDLTVELKKFFLYTSMASEVFFHTLLHNSEFCATFVEHTKMVNWKSERGCNCNYDMIDWCGCSPNDFLAADIDRLFLVEKWPVFFARKFEAVVSNRIIEQVVDKLLNARELTGEKQDGGYYWHNEYDWLDRRPPDNATMAMYQSWTRLAPKWMEMLAQCSPGKMNLRLVEQVRHNDALKGIVTVFELDATDATGSGSHGSHAIQMMWTLRPFKRITTSKLSALLMTLSIGSNFDQKEEILRDVAAAFGPNSSLTAVAQMQPISVDSVLTFVWFDPKGSLAYLKKEGLSTLNTSRTVNSTFTQLDPHMAGSWTLQLYLNTELIGERGFIVLPIEPLSTSPRRYTATAPAWLAPLLMPPSQKHAPSNAIQWTDHLVQSLWGVADICAIGPISEECVVQHCANSEWSATSSDPHRWFDKALAEDKGN